MTINQSEGAKLIFYKKVSTPLPSNEGRDKLEKKLLEMALPLVSTPLPSNEGRDSVFH